MSAFVVALGSSSLDAKAQLERAVVALAAHPLLHVASVSAAYENPAAGGATTARFLNAAAVVECALHPRALLGALHAIERAQGRVRDSAPAPWRNGSRTLDLDVVWNLETDVALVDDDVRVPHPRALERSFVAVPAVDAIERAGRVVPRPLAEAARALRCEGGPLFVRADAAIARP